MARTLLHEQVHYPPEGIEQQPAHCVPDNPGCRLQPDETPQGMQGHVQIWTDTLDKLKAGHDAEAVSGV